MYALSFSRMKYVTSLLAILFLGTIGYAAAETAFPEILRQQIIANGFKSANELYRNPDEGLITVGEIIFESKKLSLNGDISCRTCHIPKFGSADGIPNAAAIFWKGRRLGQTVEWCQTASS